MDLYAMRHAESEYNVLGLCNDDPGRNVRLTELGRRQALEAAESLRPVTLDKIYYSQLPRARETAEIVGRHLNLRAEMHTGLNDIRTGCDGEPVSMYFSRIAHDRLNARVGSGETVLEHKQRVLEFLQWMETQSKYEHVLLVAHEETMRVFAAYARGLSDEAMLKLSFANCETLHFQL